MAYYIEEESSFVYVLDVPIPFVISWGPYQSVDEVTSILEQRYPTTDILEQGLERNKIRIVVVDDD